MSSRRERKRLTDFQNHALPCRGERRIEGRQINGPRPEETPHHNELDVLLATPSLGQENGNIDTDRR